MTRASTPRRHSGCGSCSGALPRVLRTTEAGLAADLTPTRVAVLLNTVRNGPIRLAELAAQEGLNPTLLSRTVANLARGRSRVTDSRRRSTAARRGSTPHRAGRELAGEIRTQRTQRGAKRRCRSSRGGRQACRGRRTRRRSSSSPSSCIGHAHMTRDQARLRTRPSPRLRFPTTAATRRPGDLAGRHLDADDRPVVAGADAHALGHDARRDRRAADAAGAAARPVRRRDRRPRRQAPADDRAAGGDGRAGADPRGC